MPNTQPFAIYETTASNNLSLEQETHPVSNVTGSIDRERTGFGAKFIVIPNGGETGPSVTELPSQNAGLDPKQSSR